jgi:hypothetical protein
MRAKQLLSQIIGMVFGVVFAPVVLLCLRALVASESASLSTVTGPDGSVVIPLDLMVSISIIAALVVAVFVVVLIQLRDPVKTGVHALGVLLSPRLSDSPELHRTRQLIRFLIPYALTWFALAVAYLSIFLVKAMSLSLAVSFITTTKTGGQLSTFVTSIDTFSTWLLPIAGLIHTGIATAQLATYLRNQENRRAEQQARGME